jgi:hypothetical protein
MRFFVLQIKFNIVFLFFVLFVLFLHIKSKITLHIESKICFFCKSNLLLFFFLQIGEHRKCFVLHNICRQNLMKLTVIQQCKYIMEMFAL